MYLVKSVFAFGAIVSLAILAFAQASPVAQLPVTKYQRPVPSHQTGKSAIDLRVESLTRELGLNEHQRTETRKILEASQAESNRLWRNPQISPMDRMARLRALREDSQKQFRALLTEEQRIKYERYLEQATAVTPRPPAREGSDAEKRE